MLGACRAAVFAVGVPVSKQLYETATDHTYDPDSRAMALDALTGARIHGSMPWAVLGVMHFLCVSDDPDDKFHGIACASNLDGGWRLPICEEIARQAMDGKLDVDAARAAAAFLRAHGIPMPGAGLPDPPPSAAGAEGRSE